MRLLLDTHTFLWFIEGSFNLSETAKNLIEDQENQRFLSIGSLWEISIKVSIDKLKLEMTFSELVKQQVYGNAIELLEIRPEHLDELAKLPFYHKDPFDRLIISQSLVESIPIITKDSVFESYPVQILW
ncbi:type II toxin-antitoxin system VapC family toxin [Nostoc sp. NMS8]|uniref:type II toxin-antitoxin system VapC family toxin n=1 Tax=Nostoc sp. NMS8 TaxID=2815392 RepID=UPI0025F407C9|nr:type II toxin-antitoxin system VapC family toxin [Nostoc sp. NMS8]MBN3963051.1 type II toxin-antitoxin system VapC family toxin [Nostoc sp. NMS8]